MTLRKSVFCVRFALEAFAAILASVFLAVGPATASDSAAGTVSHVLVETGKVFFFQSGLRTPTPSCSTQPRWVFDATTPAGQAMLAALLSFEARGASIKVYGMETCTDWGDTESVRYIEELP